jgi:hypothetical protein
MPKNGIPMMLNPDIPTHRGESHFFRAVEFGMVTTFLKQRAFWIAVGLAGAVEGLAVYQQWPSPPVKVCASVELGELLAASAKSDAQLQNARIRLRTDPNPDTTQELMRLEAESAKALNAVANFKKREQDKQKASGASCS